MDPHLPVFAAQERLAFQPEGSPRTYYLSPLSLRQRTTVTRAIRAEAGESPDRSLFMEALRQFVRERGGDTASEDLAAIDESEAAPGDSRAGARVSLLWRQAREFAPFAALVAEEDRHRETFPYAAARHLLRGWEGPGLPEFVMLEGRVLDELLDAVPAAELNAVANRGFQLMWLGVAALGNSKPPSPSPSTQETTAAA